MTSLDLNKQGRLVVHIIGAVDLLSADSNGLSDPYVKVRSLLSPHSPPSPRRTLPHDLAALSPRVRGHERALTSCTP